jgi:hypothetical protein
MEGNEGGRNRSTAEEEICRILALAREARVVCMAIRLTLRDQSLPVTQPGLPPAEFGFVGRQPFGFAYTAGRQATFRVPCGHRFVIEHIDVSCWAKNERVEVQLVTRSRHMFRSLTVTDWPRRTSLGEEAEAPSVAPILMQGCTANTFLFSYGEVHGSSTVPPDTGLEVWGYLEPT